MSPFLWHHRTRLGDSEIELLLSGSPEASDEHLDLKWFLAALADQRPSPHHVEHMATALASVARSSVPGSLRTRRRKPTRRVVAIAASSALLFAMSGIALAADDAAPGDPLYRIDQAFEHIGIGDGGIEERIAEFDALITRGDDEAAREFLEEVIESSSADGSAEVEKHLDVVRNARAPLAEDEVAEHQQFIEEHRKDGVGADREEFGQGVADIVRDRDKDLPEPARGNRSDDPASNDNVTGLPEDTGRPDHAGPPAEPARQSNSDTNQGSNRSESPGPPDNAGKKDK